MDKSNKRQRLTIEVDTVEDKSEFNTVNEAITYRNQIQRKRLKLHKEYNKCYDIIRETEKWLLKNCKHDWKRSDIDYGPYDKPPFVCQICGIEN